MKLARHLLGLLIAVVLTRPAHADDQAMAAARAPQLENPSSYELAFLTVGIAQALRLGPSNFFVGAGVALGPPLYRIGQMKCAGTEGACDDRETRDVGLDPSLEIAQGNAFLRCSPLAQLDLDLGAKIAIASTLYGVPDSPRSAFVYGLYGDLRIGSQTIKLGPRFEFVRFAYADFYEMGWKITPLMLRIVH